MGNNKAGNSKQMTKSNNKTSGTTGNDIVLFESQDGEVRLEVGIDKETVWLTQAQLSELFNRDVATISRHIRNVFNEHELEEKSNLQILQIRRSDRPITLYSLDVVISVGYRVKSQRGVEFRRWATNVLHRYIVDGYAANERRLEQLGQVAQIMARMFASIGSKSAVLRGEGSLVFGW